MKVIETGFEGLLVIEPKVHKDNRGYFFESYNRRDFDKAGISGKFVQDNQSRSGQYVIRGLHFQIPPHAQTKLVRTISGRILDVVLDLRKGQKTFGKTYSVELSSENQRQLLVPRGFAHGFSVLSDGAEVLYKCDDYYNQEHEKGIHHNDPALGIDWGLESASPLVSEKDMVLPLMAEIPDYF